MFVVLNGIKLVFVRTSFVNRNINSLIRQLHMAVSCIDLCLHFDRSKENKFCYISKDLLSKT